MRNVAIAALVGVIALGLACDGEDSSTTTPTASLTPTATATSSPSPAPTATAMVSPSPAPTATATASPSPAAMATATASPSPAPTATATASPSPAPTATATSSPSPASTATATSSPSPATTTLAVFSTLVSEAYREEGWEWARRVYVIDIGAGTYWRAFDYLYEWATRLFTANGSIVFADGERVRRFAPDGRDETTLYEGEAIRELSVSPDGAKVAFTDANGILVLDVASGERLLRAGRDAELVALLPDASDKTFSIERWNDTSDAIAITASDGGTRNRAGILALDGDLRVLPRNRQTLAPDFRHAIRVHRDTIDDWIEVTTGFDVIELESEKAVHTVTAEADTFIIPWPGWQFGPDRFSWFALSRRIGGGLCGYDLTSRPREAGSVTAALTCADPTSIAYGDIAWWEEGFEGESAVVGPRILDVASGTIRKLARDEWRRMRADAARLSTSGFCGFSGEGAACGLWYEGRPIWTGPDLEAIGLIENDEPFEPRGVEVRATPRPSAPEAPPARGEMVGPFLAWSEVGGHEAETGEGGAERFHALRRVMVHDAGAKRSWRAFDYRYPPPDYVAEISWAYADSRPDMQVQLARAGFTVWVEDGWNAGAVRFVSLDGRETTLVEHPAIRGVLLSPSGERAVVRVEADGADGALLIFDLPSGRLSQRIPLSSLQPWFPDEWWSEDVLRLAPPSLEPTRWSADETAFTVVGFHHEYNGGITTLDSRTGVLSLDGAFRPLLPDVIEQALSPDFRYIARGRDHVGEYSAYLWESFVIADAATGRVVRSVSVEERTGMALSRNDWGWTADGRFAWSPGYRSRASAGPDDEGEAHPVDLLDVRTGGIERLAPEEYFARYVAERASSSCHEDDPIGRCTVLLDGEVVGQGQWARIIGVVGID